MESALYKSIFAQGESRGESRGEARVYAKTINKLLLRWLGTVDSSLRQRVATFPDRNILAAWHDEALELNDAESARKLLEKIQNTPSPSGSSQAA